MRYVPSQAMVKVFVRFLDIDRPRISLAGQRNSQMIIRAIRRHPFGLRTGAREVG
jgi:hypothetical protein